MDSATKCNAGFEFDSSQNGFERFVVLNSLPKENPFGFRSPHTISEACREIFDPLPSGIVLELLGNASMMVVETQHAASLS